MPCFDYDLMAHYEIVDEDALSEGLEESACDWSDWKNNYIDTDWIHSEIKVVKELGEEKLLIEFDYTEKNN